jgi:hypothetical protein
MSDLTVKYQKVSWSKWILNPILAYILSLSIANFLKKKKNADFLKGIS